MSWQVPDVAEPTLAEALEDPIIRQLMLSDGVTPADILGLIAVARGETHHESSSSGSAGTVRHH